MTFVHLFLGNFSFSLVGWSNALGNADYGTAAECAGTAAAR